MRSTGLVGSWPLNIDTVSLPTAFDMSRNGNDGVVTNATLAADGRSMVFAGADRVLMPLIPAYNFDTQMSVSAWINKDDLSGTEVVVSKSVDAGNNVSWHFNVNNQLLRLTLGEADGVSKVSYASNANVITAIDTWYHIVGTYNAGIVALYVNGSVVAGTAGGALPTTLFVGAADIIIGARDAFTNPFSGNIAQVPLHSFTRTPGQILNEFQATRNIFGV